MSGNAPDIVIQLLVWIEYATLSYFLFVNSFYALQLAGAMLEMRQHALKTREESIWRVSGSDVAPSISILAPAYNESATIEGSVRALLAIYYPNLEIAVINDGSKDETIEVLKKHFDLIPVRLIYQQQMKTQPVREIYRSRTHPNLLVVDKKNGGKADALNVGLNVSTGRLICSIDADTLIEPDALQRMVRPFLQHDDTLAAGGTIRPVNGAVVRLRNVKEATGPRKALVGFQMLEYIRAFLFGRLGWNRLGGNLIISGAFGLFQREAVLNAGGYVHDTVGEDMELVVRLRRKGYEDGGPHRVDFIPDPVAWTEVPESLKILGRQRDRWHRGLADVMWRHRRLLLNPRYGTMGLVAYPYYLFVELLAPVVEAFGITTLVVSHYLGAIDLPFALLFLLVAYGYSLVLTTFTLALDEISYHRFEKASDRLLLLLWVALENLGCRQLTVMWRLQGIFKFVRVRKDWGKMERRGFETSGDTSRN